MNWALKNVWAGFRRSALWSRLAVTDIQQTYRRSVLGMAWIALSFALFITVKIVIFGSFAAVDGRTFAIWLCIGFWVWTFLTDAVVNGCNSFIAARPWIIGTNIPLFVYVLQTTTRSIIRFSFSLPVVVAVLIIFDWEFSTQWFWTFAGIAALIVNCLWVQLFLGTLVAKYRDFGHLTQSIMQVMFFLTPILYTPEQLGDKAYLLNYNPFTHYIAIIRDPIYYQTFPSLSWQVVGAFTVVGWILALFTFQRLGPEVPFRV